MFCIMIILFFFFFKQKTAYEMRISDWSSDVCSSDLTSNWRALSCGCRRPVSISPPPCLAPGAGSRVQSGNSPDDRGAADVGEQLYATRPLLPGRHCLPLGPGGADPVPDGLGFLDRLDDAGRGQGEIGRTSGRERGW